jgi:signal transduction histidine kinase
MVVVVAASLDDRDETLNELLTSFALAGVLAVLLASALGYVLARRGLAPVEAMRRRADTVSLGRGEERLPLPDANDEIRRLGETLNQMLARLEESFERERRFVADASHDLRTPLAVVKTELEAALRSGDEADRRESIVAALAEVDHLAQLAEDLLLIARAADGQLPVRPEPVDLYSLLDRTRERFGDRAREGQRTIEVEAPADLTAQLDPLRLRQAIGNVVDNALRHGEGTVTLRATAADDEVTIAVTDEGQGFSPELAAQAFERFTRGDESRAREGSGLGLAIVKAVAEAHGGSAAIEGATVTLTFPRGSHRDLSTPREPVARSTDGG